MYNREKGKEPRMDDNGNQLPPEYQEFITRYTNDFARAAMSRWWELGDTFWTMFARGF
jgi:hypothetical protein